MNRNFTHFFHDCDYWLWKGRIHSALRYYRRWDLVPRRESNPGLLSNWTINSKKVKCLDSWATLPMIKLKHVHCFLYYLEFSCNFASFLSQIKIFPLTSAILDQLFLKDLSIIYNFILAQVDVLWCTFQKNSMEKSHFML